MRLTDALAKISSNTPVKTAAAASIPAPANATAQAGDVGERLKQALKEATDASTKTASVASPIEDLTKIAADLSRAEHDAMVKEAQLYGAAVCDGFMARAAQYNEVAQKTASAQPAAQGFDKFAAENPSIVKEAADLGYATTMGQLEKLAEDAYAKGWNDTMTQVHKVASDAFVAGFTNGNAIIEALR